MPYYQEKEKKNPLKEKEWPDILDKWSLNLAYADASWKGR